MVMDRSGYYAALGLNHTASANEIRAAFRHLAKRSHPDVNSKTDGGDNFRKISEAYSVLRDSQKRAHYDRQNLNFEQKSDKNTENPKPNAKSLKPSKCEVCCQITAQPRHITFWKVSSFILVTKRTPTQKIFCYSCAERESLRACLYTAAFGWWGLPWGPILTVVEGVKDAFGGHYDRKVEDELLWHNAQAFSAIGSIALSYGLTERLANSPNEAVRSDALNLASVMMAAGFKPSVKLKNPWVLSLSAIGLKLGALSVVPAILTLTFLIYNKDSFNSSSLPITPSSAPLYSTLPTEVVPPSLGTPKGTSVAIVPKPAQSCKRMPRNGKILIGASRLRLKGHTLTINNGSGGNAIVNVRNAFSGKLFASMFVGKNDQAVMLGIPDGRFRIQYAFGGDLAKSCKSFVELFAAGEFPDQEQLQTITESNYLETVIKRMRISYTLYTVPAGNVQPSSINENEFDAP